MWTETEIPSVLRRPEARERLRMPAERSDILRLEILWREGCVYVDTDFECRGSLEPLLDGAEFVTANLFPHRVNNAFIASVPGHVILDEALAEMKPREFFGFDRWAAGPFCFNSIVERHKGSPGVRLLAPELMYPRTLAERERALAIHHVARSWKDADELHEDVLRAERRLREVQDRLEQELRAHEQTRRAPGARSAPGVHDRARRHAYDAVVSLMRAQKPHGGGVDDPSPDPRPADRNDVTAAAADVPPLRAAPDRTWCVHERRSAPSLTFAAARSSSMMRSTASMRGTRV